MDAQDIAHFLYKGEGLNKTAIGKCCDCEEPNEESANAFPNSTVHSHHRNEIKWKDDNKLSLTKAHFWRRFVYCYCYHSSLIQYRHRVLKRGHFSSFSLISLSLFEYFHRPRKFHSLINNWLYRNFSGDYLGEKNDFNEQVLKAFVELHDFTNLILVQALRWVFCWLLNGNRWFFSIHWNDSFAVCNLIE